MTTVYYMCLLYMDGTENMRIWDMNTENEVFNGTFDDAMHSGYEDYDVCSYGIEGNHICLNINTEE